MMCGGRATSEAVGLPLMPASCAFEVYQLRYLFTLQRTRRPPLPPIAAIPAECMGVSGVADAYGMKAGSWNGMHDARRHHAVLCLWNCSVLNFSEITSALFM